MDSIMINYYKTVNPLQFVAENILRQNTTLVSIKEECIPADVPLEACMDYFRRTIPAGTSCLIFSQATVTVLQMPSTDFLSGDTEAFYLGTGRKDGGSISNTSRITGAGATF